MEFIRRIEPETSRRVGAERAGQRLAPVLADSCQDLASFEPEPHLTIVCDGIGRRLLGSVSSTYTVVPAGEDSRLVLSWSRSRRAAGCSAPPTGG